MGSGKSGSVDLFFMQNKVRLARILLSFMDAFTTDKQKN
jgi:hypothetical protein